MYVAWSTHYLATSCEWGSAIEEISLQETHGPGSNVSRSVVSFSDTTPCTSKDNHLPSFRKNLLPQSSRKKVVPSYREDAAAGCILRHMAYFWIATPFPLFIRFESQLLSALPRIKLHLKGQRSQGTDNVQQECDGGAEDYSGRMATSLD